MVERPQTVDDVIDEAIRALSRAFDGIELVKSQEVEKIYRGVSDVAVWGRSSTLLLQSLSSVAEAWDEFWKPWQEMLSSDSLCAYFASLRNYVLKSAKSRLSLRAVSPAQETFAREIGTPPVPGARIMLSFEHLARWVVVREDGRAYDHSQAIPPPCMRVHRSFADTPDKCFPEEFWDWTLEAVCEEYLRRVSNVIERTVEKYSPTRYAEALADQAAMQSPSE